MYDSTEDTKAHMREVEKLMTIVSDILLERAKKHDLSKLQSPEKEIFDVYTPKLKDSTYGSDEYKKFLDEMKIALDHHYLYNSHHPQFFENGILGMSLISLIEMFCDWWASSKRHNNGDILESIKINQERFGYTDELKWIFINTVYYINEVTIHKKGKRKS